MKIKSCAAFKAARDAADDTGEFEAIVSVFGNKDSVGDVVLPGAFADTLAEWKSSGDPIPVLWSHRMDDPRYSIGSVQDAAELEAGDSRIPEWADEWLKSHGGLWVKGQIDTGPDASDIAKAARGLLLKRLVKQFSYAYDIVDGGWGTADHEDAYELRKLDLFEVSPTQIGANGLTELIGAKADAMCAALDERTVRGMSTKALREAKARISAVLAERNTGDADTSDSGPVNDEEPAQVKSKEPARRDDESMRILSNLLILEMEFAS